MRSERTASHQSQTEAASPTAAMSGTKSLSVRSFGKKERKKERKEKKNIWGRYETRNDRKTNKKVKQKEKMEENKYHNFGQFRPVSVRGESRKALRTLRNWADIHAINMALNTVLDQRPWLALEAAPTSATLLLRTATESDAPPRRCLRVKGSNVVVVGAGDKDKHNL